VILAGIFLNICVCGTLMKDLEWTSFRAKQKRKLRQENRRKTSMDSFSITTSTNNGIATEGSEKGCNIDINVVETIAEEDPHLFSSLINLPTFADKGEKVSFSIVSLLAIDYNFSFNAIDSHWSAGAALQKPQFPRCFAAQLSASARSEKFECQ
jgi:hypothetical protein